VAIGLVVSIIITGHLYVTRNKAVFVIKSIRTYADEIFDLWPSQMSPEEVSSRRPLPENGGICGVNAAEYHIAETSSCVNNERSTRALHIHCSYLWVYLSNVLPFSFYTHLFKHVTCSATSFREWVSSAFGLKKEKRNGE